MPSRAPRGSDRSLRLALRSRGSSLDLAKRPPFAATTPAVSEKGSAPVSSDGMSVTSEAPLAADRFKRRLEFERLISDLSSRFIALAPGDVDREIEDALRRVCELLGLDLAGAGADSRPRASRKPET